MKNSLVKSQAVRQLYRLILVLCCQTGIVLQYAIAFRIGKMEMLNCYYTMHSNFVVLLYFIYLLITVSKKEHPLLKGTVVTCISITGLVYHFALQGAMEAGVSAVSQLSNMEIWANNLVHYVVPIMTVGDYLLFSKKGNFRWWYPFVWIVLPFIYSIFIMVFAEVSGSTFGGFSDGPSRYPYPFIDVDKLGFAKVMLNIVICLVAALLLGFIFYGLDKLLALLGVKLREKKRSGVSKKSA